MSEEPMMQVRLRREQICLLAQNVTALVVSLLITSIATASLLWANGQPRSRILAWLGVTLTVVTWRGAMLRRFRLRTAAGDAPEDWSRTFVLAAALSGACWGSLGLLFYTPDDPLNLAAVTIIVTTMLVNATQSLGPYFPAHLSFALPCALPLVVQFLASDHAAIVRLGVLGVLVIIMSELYSLRMARSIRNALQLRFENESLADQLRIEKERAESASVAKTRFLATASHDLRQPVHAMNLFVPALKALSNRPEISPPVVGGIADRLQGALDTMAQLLSRLLDLSRLDAGAMQPKPTTTALQPLLSKVRDEVTQQARNKGLRLRVRDGGLAVHTDAAVLYTILSNLAGNAVRYTERGGVLLAARRRGERVRIEVWDTGVGIGANDLPHVTEEFF